MADNPSGVQGEEECSSDHYLKNDVVDNPCTECGAQV